jgi:hypothetical protein
MRKGTLIHVFIINRIGWCHMPRTKATQLYIPTASFVTTEECKEIKV